MGGAARRDGHTGVGSGAEAKAGLTDGGGACLEGAIVNGTVTGFLVALLSSGAELPSVERSQAGTAAVVAEAAGRDSDACVSDGTQTETSITSGGDTGSGNAVVNSTVGRGRVAILGGGAEAETRGGRDTRSATVGGGAARGDGDASVGLRAETEASSTLGDQAGLVGAVVQQAVGGLLVALLGGGAEHPTGFQAGTNTAAVRSQAARRGGDTLVGSDAEGGVSGTLGDGASHANAIVYVAVGGLLVA